MDTLSLARFDRMLTLPSGERVRLRPIRPDDEPRLSELYDRSSRDTRYQRFFTVMLVAEDVTAPTTRLIGVARYEPGGDDIAEIALVVEDAWQGKGVGTRLLTELFRAAAENGITRFRAFTLADNRRMLGLLARHADVIERRVERGVVEMVLAPKAYPPRTVSTGE